MGKTSKYTATLTETMVRIDKVTPAGKTEWKYSDNKELRIELQVGYIPHQSHLRKIYREL